MNRKESEANYEEGESIPLERTGTTTTVPVAAAPVQQTTVIQKTTKEREFVAETKKPVAKRTDKLHRWFHWSYLLDWLVAGILLGVVSGILHWEDDPRIYPLSNRFPHPNLDYPLLDSIISNTVSIIIAIFVPMVIVVIIQLIERCRWKKSWEEMAHDVHHAALSVAIALILAQIWTDPIRYSVGRMRPSFYARLATGDEGIIEAGRLSFTCNHCSRAFSSFTFLFFYLLGRLRVFRQRYGELWRFCIAALPLVWATYASITRLVDFSNHFADVVGGAIIGAIAGVIAYHLQYHWLWSRWSSRPKKRYHDYDENLDATRYDYEHNHHLYNDYHYY